MEHIFETFHNPQISLQVSLISYQNKIIHHIRELRLFSDLSSHNKYKRTKKKQSTDQLTTANYK